MHETFPVKVGEDIQNGVKHLPGFGRRERPAGKDLREVLLGTLHYGIDKYRTIKIEATRVMDRNQVRVRQLSGLLPTRELEFSIFWSRGNNFDGGFYETFTLVAFGEKYRALFGSAYVSKQRELLVENMVFPLFPVVGHDSTFLKGRPGSDHHCTQVRGSWCQANAGEVPMRIRRERRTAWKDSYHARHKGVRRPDSSAIRPGLSCEVRQVVGPVIFLHAAGVNHVGQIVFRVG